MPKKYITVQVEVDFYDDDDEEGRTVESVLPDLIQIHGFSEDELRDTRRYLREDDDASFDFMWDLRSLLRHKEDETNAQD